MDNPCRGCCPPKRHEGCHGICPEHKTWKEYKEAEAIYARSRISGWVDPVEFSKLVKNIRKNKR